MIPADGRPRALDAIKRCMKPFLIIFLPTLALILGCFSRTNSIEADQNIQNIEYHSDGTNADSSNQDTSNCPTILDSVLNRQVYSYAQEMPKFPGGQNEFYNFIHKNLENTMPRDSIQGSVRVAFIIEIDGSVSDAYAPKPYFKNGLSSLEKNLIRLLKEMPNWTPATCNGKPVPIRFNLPVHL